jgi:hypothetical protein
VQKTPYTNLFPRRSDLTANALGDAGSLNKEFFAVRRVDWLQEELFEQADIGISARLNDIASASVTREPSDSFGNKQGDTNFEITSSVSISEGATAGIEGAGTQSVTFTGTTGTLTIDHSLAFTGAITGLAGTDALDLVDVGYGATTTATFLGNTAGGTLTVSDGAHTSNISLVGNYLSSSWTLSSDGHGGTVVVDPVANNAWQTLKVGGGGLLSGLNIAPDGTMVVRADTYGAYIWNGSQWQQLVTMASMPAGFAQPGTGQGVYEIQIAPSNSNILYMMYNGYVLKSTDKGTIWTKTSFAQVTESANASMRADGEHIAIDPNNPNVVYVGTPQNGLWVTKDGGTSWQSVAAVPVSLTNPGGEYPGITGVVFDPATGGGIGGNTNTIFASSYGNGVYESTDGGASWSHLSGGPTNVEHATVSSTGVYYAVGNDNSSLWSYANGSWTELVTPSSINGQWVAAVAVNPLNPSEIVFANGGGDLSFSFDAGQTWSGFYWTQHLNSTDIPWLATAGGSIAYLSTSNLAFSPTVPNQLIASTGIGVWTASSQPPSSGVVVWNDQSLGIEQLVANQIIVPPGGNPVLASWDRGFFYIGDENTYPSAYGPVSGDFVAGWSLDYASSNPGFLVGIADWYNNEDSGYSTDGGQTWTPFASKIPGAGTNYIGGTIAASSPTDIVWAPADGNQPYYTLNGGISWSPVVLPGVTSWSGFDFNHALNAHTVTADRVLANTFYMYDADLGNPDAGVFKSTDGGASWTKVFSGQLSIFSFFSSKIESVPGEAGNLFFTGGSQATYSTEPFLRSTDGGTTWTAIPNVTEVLCFGFGAPAAPGGYPSIYIAGWVNSVYGVWQSNDNAQSWIQIGDYPLGSLDGITTITGDPNVYGQVYLGFQGSGYAQLSATPTTNPPSQTIMVSSGTPTLSTTTEAHLPLTPSVPRQPMLSTSTTPSTDTGGTVSVPFSGRDTATTWPLPPASTGFHFSRLSKTLDITNSEAAISPSRARAGSSHALSLALERGSIVATAGGGGLVDHRIALLSQYTAAGFHVRGNTGAIVNPVDAGSGTETTQPIWLAKAAEHRGGSI